MDDTLINSIVFVALVCALVVIVVWSARSYHLIGKENLEDTPKDSWWKSKPTQKDPKEYIPTPRDITESAEKPKPILMHSSLESMAPSEFSFDINGNKTKSPIKVPDNLRHTALDIDDMTASRFERSQDPVKKKIPTIPRSILMAANDRAGQFTSVEDYQDAYVEAGTDRSRYISTLQEEERDINDVAADGIKKEEMDREPVAEFIRDENATMSDVMQFQSAAYANRLNRRNEVQQSMGSFQAEMREMSRNLEQDAYDRRPKRPNQHAAVAFALAMSDTAREYNKKR